ncbi:MAG TPA: Fe-S cluster assembly protein HesB [Nocardioides sp.]|nr:Fe-S cluster assembly protein HesB [Nocardioides sp.]
MLTLTPTAASAVKIVSQSFGATGVRITARGAGSPGEFDMNLVSAPQEEDVTVEQDGAHVYLDLDAALALEGQTLDARITDDGAPEFGVVAPS